MSTKPAIVHPRPSHLGTNRATDDLLHAIKASDHAAAVKALDAGASIDGNAEREYDKPLGLAVSAKDAPMVQLLIERGAKTHHSLFSLVFINDKELKLTELLIRGIDDWHQTTEKGTNIWLSIFLDAPSANVFRIAHELSPNPDGFLRQIDKTLRSPLEYAIRRNLSEQVDHILANGVVPDTKAFMCAAEHDTSLLERFWNNTIDIDRLDEKGLSALHHAAEDGDHETCRKLLDWGADINNRSSDGLTPILSGATRESVLRLLRDRGADLSAICDRGCNVAMHCAERTPSRFRDVFEVFKDRPEVFLHRDHAGQTVLHVLAAKVMFGVDLEWLVRSELGQRMIDARDQKGVTPLIEAASPSTQHLVDPLIRGGADVNARDRTGITALMVAASVGATHSCAMLIMHGADIDAVDRSGCSVLDRAFLGTNQSCTPCTRYLLACGASFNTLDPLNLPLGIDTERNDAIHESIFLNAAKTDCAAFLQFHLKHHPKIKEKEIKLAQKYFKQMGDSASNAILSSHLAHLAVEKVLPQTSDADVSMKKKIPQ